MGKTTTYLNVGDADLVADLYVFHATKRIIVEASLSAGWSRKEAAGTIASAVRDGRCAPSDEISLAVAKGYEVIS